MPNIENNPWIIIGDLNELSILEEKNLAKIENSTRYDNFNISYKKITLLI